MHVWQESLLRCSSHFFLRNRQVQQPPLLAADCERGRSNAVLFGVPCVLREPCESVSSGARAIDRGVSGVGKEQGDWLLDGGPEGGD